MKKVNIYTISILVILMTSCGKKTEEKFYDTGQVKEERIYEKRNDTTKYFVVYHYSNGQIQSKGSINEGYRNGIWQEWYADGSIKWNGVYDSGQRKFELLSSNPKIVIEDSILKRDKQTYLKVYIEGIHPEDIAIACNNGIIRVADRKEMFDYMVTPKKQGIIKFTFFVKKDGEMLNIGVDSLKVVE